MPCHADEVECLKRTISFLSVTGVSNLDSKTRRPSYYAAERKRRLALARARHSQGRRATTNPRPSLGAIPALADPSAERTERTPRRILGWLRRRRSA